MASTAIFSGHILNKCTQLPPAKARSRFPVEANKINGVSISYLKVKPERKSCIIRASESSSISVSPGITPDVLSKDVESSLAVAEVYDLSGNVVRLTDLWKERKAVVAFARHFGCVLCRKRADILASQKGSMDAAGVALVLIGPGSIDQAKEFAKQTQFPGEVYADPSHSTFNALKFVSGVATTFTPLAGMKIIESYLQGYRQDWRLSFQKETVNRGGWQQGGILVAGPGENNVVYLHKIARRVERNLSSSKEWIHNEVHTCSKFVKSSFEDRFEILGRVFFWLDFKGAWMEPCPCQYSVFLFNRTFFVIIGFNTMYKYDE